MRLAVPNTCASLTGRIGSCPSRVVVHLVRSVELGVEDLGAAARVRAAIAELTRIDATARWMTRPSGLPVAATQGRLQARPPPRRLATRLVARGFAAAGRISGVAWRRCGRLRPSCTRLRRPTPQQRPRTAARQLPASRRHPLRQDRRPQAGHRAPRAQRLPATWCHRDRRRLRTGRAGRPSVLPRRAFRPCAAPAQRAQQPRCRVIADSQSARLSRPRSSRLPHPRPRAGHHRFAFLLGASDGAEFFGGA